MQQNSLLQMSSITKGGHQRAQSFTSSFTAPCSIHTCRLGIQRKRHKTNKVVQLFLQKSELLPNNVPTAHSVWPAWALFTLMMPKHHANFDCLACWLDLWLNLGLDCWAGMIPVLLSCRCLFLAGKWALVVMSGWYSMQPDMSATWASFAYFFTFNAVLVFFRWHAVMYIS
jgi:hypothetical protein